MSKKYSRTFYLALALSWLLFGAWLVYGHQRTIESSKAALLLRSQDISNTLGVLIRSQRRFGVVHQRRLEAALQELAESRELIALALLNSAGDVVASAGDPLEFNLVPANRANLKSNAGVRWQDDSVVIVNFVDLGEDAVDEDQRRPATILLREEDWRTSEPLRGDDKPDSAAARVMGPPYPPPPPREQRLDEFAATSGPLVLAFNPDDDERRRERRNSRRFIRQAMANLNWEELREKQGLHGFVLKMSIAELRADGARDLKLRAILGALGLLAALGLAAAWRALEGALDLRLELERSNQLNAHLQELNVTAAGLAHETRNPLNIVRGLAQLISKDPQLAGELRQKAAAITEEVDRVTGRLNEFINYSRQPEPRLERVALNALVRDVEKALESDRADKAIRFELNGPDAAVEADPALLRQVMFNLLLNACQALGRNGRVEVLIQCNRETAALEIRDDGPGIPETLRADLFKPYVTARHDGTGLGLAVVRQIALAHGWEINALYNGGAGATFRLSGLKLLH